MATVVVAGGGLVGNCTAMLLAADGHSVTVLERDPDPPPASAEEAWSAWTRRGVNQFHMIHYFLPRFREIVERELPDVAAALDADGALRFNPLEAVPVAISGGVREGDERFQSLTGRRPVVEAAVERVAARTEGVTVRRGVAVRGLLVGEGRVGAPPHVVGVVTDDGTEHRADLVVDAGGRRSAMPTWIAALGGRPIAEDRDDCGFVYLARHFRSGDGSLPPPFGPPLQAYESVSTLTLPADNGTWGVGLIASAHDSVMRSCRDVDRWTEVVQAVPARRALDRRRADHRRRGDGRHRRPAAHRGRRRCARRDRRGGGRRRVGVHQSLAWVGARSIGIMHAEALRDVLRAHPYDDAEGFAIAWHDATRARVDPFVRDTLHFDRHRLAEIDAHCDGRPYETDDEDWLLGEAFAAAAGGDPDVFRAFLETISLYERVPDVLARPGVTERVRELAGGAGTGSLPGPGRADLLAMLGS